MDKVFNRIWADFGHIEFLWQLVALALCCGLAWWLALRLRQWVRSRRLFGAKASGSSALANELREAGARAAERIVWPMLALVLTYIVRPMLERHQSVSLFDLAIPLLLGFGLIRILIYMLQRTFPTAGWLEPFERWIAGVIWVGLALNLTGIDEALLGSLEQFQVPIGKTRASMRTIIEALASAAVTLLIALWLGRTIESRLMRSEAFDPSLRVVLSRVLRTLLAALAVLIAMSMVGLDLTVLSVFGGALGVGLGLGLQRIASNYVSGFIILLDRGLRIGDTITVDKYSGRVTDIKTRYTVVRALDGNDAVIPNELLISQPVLNHSLSTPRVCISLSARVVHGTDVSRAFAIMDAAARAHPRVLAIPAPSCGLRQFGSEGLDLELSFWIADPQNGSGPVKSDLNLAILRGFAEARIEIPHPAHIPGIVAPVDEVGPKLAS